MSYNIKWATIAFPSVNTELAEISRLEEQILEIKRKATAKLERESIITCPHCNQSMLSKDIKLYTYNSMFGNAFAECECKHCNSIIHIPDRTTPDYKKIPPTSIGLSMSHEEELNFHPKINKQHLKNISTTGKN